jgi:hypothetical protein
MRCIEADTLSNRIDPMPQATGNTSQIQEGMSDTEMSSLVARCPEEHRWAFNAWLRGERSLDGDLIACAERYAHAMSRFAGLRVTNDLFPSAPQTPAEDS